MQACPNIDSEKTALTLVRGVSDERLPPFCAAAEGREAKPAEAV